jgi:hypothetical protein
VPYEKVERPDLKMPKRPASTGYRRTERDLQHYVADFAATLDGSTERPVKYVDPEETDVFIPEEPEIVAAPAPAVRRRTRRAATEETAPEAGEAEDVPSA